MDPKDISPEPTENPLGCLGWLAVGLFVLVLVAMALADGGS
jgi:hypothetical protein